MTHAALVEQKYPREAVQRFLMIYRSTPHSTTGKSPSEMLQGRKLRLKMPIMQQKAEGQIHNEARNKNQAEKEKQKKYVDKRRRATKRKSW